MQGRSWMAALTLTTATALALTLTLQAGADEKTASHKVRLRLFIAGLYRQGCDVEIKPGHSGCRFRPVTQHVNQDGQSTVVLDDVQTASADKECAFAITMVEPNQPVRTVYKGLRLRRSGLSDAATLDCFLSSPSKMALAREEKNKTRR